MARRVDPRDIHYSGGVAYDHTGAVVNPNNRYVYEESRATQSAQQAAYDRAQADMQRQRANEARWAKEAWNKANGTYKSKNSSFSYGIGGGFTLGLMGALAKLYLWFVAAVVVFALGYCGMTWFLHGFFAVVDFLLRVLKDFVFAWPRTFQHFTSSWLYPLEIIIGAGILVKRYQAVRKIDTVEWLERMDAFLCVIPFLGIELFQAFRNSFLQEYALSDMIFRVAGLSCALGLFVWTTKKVAYIITEKTGPRITPYPTVLDLVRKLIQCTSDFVIKHNKSKDT